MTAATEPPPPSIAPAYPFREALAAADRALIFIGVLMLLGVVKFLVAGNTEPDNPAGAGDPLVRASWYPFYLALVAALATRIRGVARSLVSAWPILLLLLLTAASQSWSVAPDVTSRRIVAAAFTVLFGVYLATRGDRMETLRIVGAAILVSALFNLAIIGVMPATGVDQNLHAGAWKGILVEKNALGGDMARAALVMLALAWADPQRRRIWIGGLALTALLVLGSTSRTALLALLIPCALFALFLLGRRSPVVALGVFYLSATVGVAIAMFILFAPERAVGLIGKDMTLTGRTGIWDATLDKIMEMPWTGYGFGAFWVDPYGPSYDVRVALEWIVPSAHNNWLEIGLALGVPGMAVLALTVLLALGRSGVSVLHGASPWVFLGLAQLSLFSLSESGIFWQPNMFSCTLFAFYATCALLPAARREPAVPAPPQRDRLRSATRA